MDGSKPQPLFSLDEIERIIVPCLLLIAIHGAAVAGSVLWFSGHQELVVNPFNKTVNGSGWSHYEVTLNNYSLRATCQSCCKNGQVTSGKIKRNGGPAWERHIHYTVHTVVPIVHVEDGTECTQPDLGTSIEICEPPPCQILGGVWCFNYSCSSNLLWRHPREEAADLRLQASSNVFYGPLLIMPAVLTDAYLILVLICRKLRVIVNGEPHQRPPLDCMSVEMARSQSEDGSWCTH